MRGDDLWTWIAKYDPDQPRDGHGMWSSGGGGGGGGDARASASLSDRAFVSQHAERLSAAGDSAREAFPRDQRAGDAAHAAAHRAIVAEAGRIHAENDAVAGPDERHLRGVLNDARLAGASHDTALEHVAEERASLADERAAVAAGHIGTAPRAEMDAYAATRTRVDVEVNGEVTALAAAHDRAERALVELQARAVDADSENGVAGTSHHTDDVGGLVEHLRSTDEAFGAPARSEHASDYAGHPGDHPNSEDDPSELAAYHAASAANDASFREHAAHAQDALEHLHAQQIRTQGKLRSASHDLDVAHERAINEVDSENVSLVHESAFAHHTYRDSEEPSPPEPLDAGADAEERLAHATEIAAYHRELAQYQERQRAETASSRILDAERRRRDALADDRPKALSDDARDALKDEIGATVAAIRRLSALTGRTKKNRPGVAGGASVGGMAQPAKHKLKLTKLEFLSLVDSPAQETAAIRLIKHRDGTDEMRAKIFKIDGGDDPLIWCWAFTCTDENGKPYHDLQGDAITPDFIKAAEEFIKQGGAVDEMHDGQAKSRIAFAFPMDSEIATAMLGEAAGAATKISGLMVAIRPTADQLEKARKGDYTGVSIAGTGVRELVKAAGKGKVCKACGGAYGNAEKCAACGAVGKSVLSTADKDSLPDSAFLYIEGGGSKDSGGKTTPRSLRHFPYRTASGGVDIVHLRAAISDIPKSSLSADLRDKLQVRAEKLLAAQHDKAAKRVTKQAVLTSAADGHQHSIDLDDPADEWRDQLSTSYQTSEGADNGHSHAWTYDAQGKITIAEDSGHTHTVDAVVPADVLAQAALNEDGERCQGCGDMCDDDCKFCPNCGAAMKNNGAPTAPVADDDSSPVVIIARAPEGISTPHEPTPTVKGITEEHQMADPTEEVRMLKSIVARLEKTNQLTDAQRAHFEKLKGADAEQFLALAPHQRQAVIDDIAKADEVIYTSTESGKEYRKSCPLEIIEAVKATDAALKLARETEIAKQDWAFAKRGDEVLSHFAKGVKGDLRARLIKAVTKEFLVPAEFEEAIKALKGADAAFATLSKTIGTEQGGDPEAAKTPIEAWNTGLAEYAKSAGVTNPLDAIIPFIKTDKGKTLKRALDAQRPMASPAA